MSSFLKQRPVGNRVPRYRCPDPVRANWSGDYKAIFLDSGTSALSCAVKLAIHARQPIGTPEVLIPAYGCPDLIAAVVAQGAIPVLVDLTPNRPWMDLVEVEAAVSDNTVAIVAVNFLGIPERLSQLSKIAKGNSVHLIDDSAQCFPPTTEGESFADCIILSFGRGKPINLMGGGALLVRPSLEADASLLLSNYKTLAMPGPFIWAMKRVLINILLGRLPYSLLSRLSFLKLGQTRYKPLEKIHKIEYPEGPLHSGIEDILARPTYQLEYDRRLQEWAETSDFLLLAPVCKSENDLLQARYSYPLLRYAILMNNKHERSRLMNLFEQEGLGVNTFYGKALIEVDGVANVTPKFPAVIAPNAQSFAERLLVLPTHDAMSIERIAKISQILKGRSSPKNFSK